MYCALAQLMVCTQHVIRDEALIYWRRLTHH